MIPAAITSAGTTFASLGTARMCTAGVSAPRSAGSMPSARRSSRSRIFLVTKFASHASSSSATSITAVYAHGYGSSTVASQSICPCINTPPLSGYRLTRPARVTSVP